MRWLVFVVLLAPMASARAEEPLDRLVLDGTVLQGHVAELKPRKHVILVLLSGETRVVEWAHVAHSSGPAFAALRGAGEATAAGPASFDGGGAESATLDGGAATAAGRAPLTIESLGPPQQVALDQRLVFLRGRVFTLDNPQCTTPCTLPVEPGARVLHMAGERVVATTTDIVVPPAGLRLKMYAPSTVHAGVGAGLLAGGILATGRRGQLRRRRRRRDRSQDEGFHDGFFDTGGVMLGGGAAMIIGAVTLLARNKHGIA